ncbi:hypothetical protein D3C75_406880 [compost metagenome]
MRHQIEHRLQAAVTQPALHPPQPLRGIVHLRRDGTDHDDRFCPAPGRLLHRDRIADAAIQIRNPIQQRAGAIETRYRAGGAKNIQPVLLQRRKVARGVIIPATRTHPEGFAGIKQARGIIHRQRHLAGGSIQQPVEIDKIATAHKAQWVEELAGSGVTHDHFAGVARLIADVGREILRPG